MCSGMKRSVTAQWARPSLSTAEPGLTANSDYTGKRQNGQLIRALGWWVVGAAGIEAPAQGLKPGDFVLFAARLKPCPDTKNPD